MSMKSLIPSCWNKCSVIIDDLKKSKEVKIFNLIMKHTKKYQDEYSNKIMGFFIQKDIVGIIRIFREIIKNANFKNDFMLIINSIYEIDKQNINYIDKITDCILNNCDKDSIEFVYEVIGLFGDMLTIINEDDIINKFTFFRNKIIEIIREKERELKKYGNKMIKEEKIVKVNSEVKKVNPKDTVNKVKKVNPKDTVKKVNKVKKVNPKDTVKKVNKVKKVNPKDTVKKVKKVNSKDTVKKVKKVNSRDTVKKVKKVNSKDK